MILNLRRVVASAIPLAVLASTTLASDAQQFGRIYHPFAVRPYATGATTLGGGATLPIPGYLGLSESSGSTNFGKAGSLFGYFATVSGGLNVEYCATGSGKGRGVFEGATGTVNTPCSNAVSGTTATVFGFLPPSGTPKQNFPTLAGTDAPIATQVEYNTYSTNHASGEPVELPSIFGAIAIYYHLNGQTTRLNIATSTLCGVYDGRIKTYGALLGTSNTTPIIPVYRSDGSGTTFNFSNHLATVCSSSDPSAYNGNQTSTGATATTEAFPKLPTNAVGASGNGGVIAAVAATTANGYLGIRGSGLPHAGDRRHARREHQLRHDRRQEPDLEPTRSGELRCGQCTGCECRRPSRRGPGKNGNADSSHRRHEVRRDRHAEFVCEALDRLLDHRRDLPADQQHGQRLVGCLVAQIPRDHHQHPERLQEPVGIGADHHDRRSGAHDQGRSRYDRLFESRLGVQRDPQGRGFELHRRVVTTRDSVRGPAAMSDLVSRFHFHYLI